MLWGVLLCGGEGDWPKWCRVNCPICLAVGQITQGVVGEVIFEKNKEGENERVESLVSTLSPDKSVDLALGSSMTTHVKVHPVAFCLCQEKRICFKQLFTLFPLA